MIFLGPLSIPAEALFCGHPAHFTVCKEFKKTACSIGPGNVRFHGLRHGGNQGMIREKRRKKTKRKPWNHCNSKVFSGAEGGI